ncbi:MAG: PepSY domain-containing protein [Chitinophagaceae bacterium]
MTISIWRYSHLVLAVSCFVFLAIASVTGIILGIDAVMAPRPHYVSSNIDTISLNVLVPRLQSNYMEINILEIEDHQFVSVKGLDNDGNDADDYIDPANGKRIVGHKGKSAFIQSVTSFHRSLFLHETGRFFVGLTSFLLVLITVSSIALVLKQQKSLRRFFASFSKESFSQYYHVLLGRWSLVPILVIALTGTYLSLVKFNVFPEKKIELKTPENGKEEMQQPVADFASFKNIKLKDLRSISFPFAADPDEYYKIQLKDREILVNQFNGKIVAEEKYPLVNVLNTVSLNLHTGRTSIVWAIVLTIASVNILFFIYSGFVITFKRRRNKIKNKYKAADAEYLLLVGSENGTTIHFANNILKQLLSHGVKAHLAEMNTFQLYDSTKQIVFFAATFGLGDAPTNATKFLQKIGQTDHSNNFQYSIVGFGSTRYPDFCGFAKKVADAFQNKLWAMAVLPLHTVNDRSLTDFAQWVKAWSDYIHLPLVVSPNYYADTNKKKLRSFTVVEKTEANDVDHIFVLTLKPNASMDFRSGDLLAIYPEGDEKERLYSIGRIGKNIQLVVKLHPRGIGSSFLHRLQKGDKLKAAIMYNNGFHLERKQPPTILVSNGTGIAPFLGMLDENRNGTPIVLYAGFRKKVPHQTTILAQLTRQERERKLNGNHVVYSRELGSPHRYVYELIEKDMAAIRQVLDDGGVMMICGSISMQTQVLARLQQGCPNFQTYRMLNQIRSDCY